MSTNTAKTTNKETVTADNMAEMMEKILQGQTEVLQKQDVMARTVADFDGRLNKIEGSSAKQNAEENLQAAVEQAEQIKGGALGKFKQASTGKKVIIATAATAVVAGVGYASYKGYEMYQGRKAIEDQNILGVQAIGTPVTPAKQDAIRQGLGLNK